MGRRRFLRGLVAGGGGLVLSRCKKRKEPPVAEPGLVGHRVIVVGAGAAGIACAASLVSRGAQVVVLEARDRLGGRIYTDRSLGFPVERGANWIEGETDNPIAAAASRLGIKTVVDSSEGALFAPDGSALDGEGVAFIEEVRGEMESELEKLSERLERDTSVESALRSLISGERLSTEERIAVNFVLAGYELDVAGPLDRVSLWHADEGEGFGGESLFLPGGYDQIVSKLASGLDVRLSEPVVEIASEPDGVTVVTEKAEHRANTAVVSVPLGALKRNAIRFRPALSARKRKAVAALDMGTLNKVILRFPRAFWPSGVGTFFYVSETRGEFPQIVDWNAFGGKPALLLFQAGAFASRAENWSDTESVDRAMAVVRKCFGKSAPDPDGHLVQRWNADPWTHGSYSYLPTGASPDDRDALAAPEAGGRLRFCGEATHRDFPATVHGAYLSGEREAARIAEAARG